MILLFILPKPQLCFNWEEVLSGSHEFSKAFQLKNSSLEVDQNFYIKFQYFLLTNSRKYL